MRKSNWESFLQIFETTTKRNSACLTSLKFIELKHLSLSALQMMNHPKRYHNNITPTLLQLPPQKKGRKPQKPMTNEFNQTSVFSSNVTTRPRLASSTTSTIRSSWVTWSILTSGRLGLHLVWGGIAAVRFFGPSDGVKLEMRWPRKHDVTYFWAITGHTYWLMAVPN